MEDVQHWSPLVPELMVTALDRSLDFYTRLLGFNVLYHRCDPKFCYLDQDGSQLMLQEVHDAYWETGELTYPFGRGINLQIELSDIESAHRRLNGDGYPLYRDVKISEYLVNGKKFRQQEFLVQDPDGYLLRFCRPIEV